MYDLYPIDNVPNWLQLTTASSKYGIHYNELVAINCLSSQMRQKPAQNAANTIDGTLRITEIKRPMSWLYGVQDPFYLILVGYEI